MNSVKGFGGWAVGLAGRHTEHPCKEKGRTACTAPEGDSQTDWPLDIRWRFLLFDVRRPVE